MKAVIMAGGEGTRLRPLTAKSPKPLAPILGESAMSHIIRLLKKHGAKNTAVTLMFMPEAIKSKYGGSFEGVNLSYYEEKSPLGTAGSVKNTSRFLLDETGDSHSSYFTVISGDAVCDTDLTKAAHFHESSKADVTIILTASEKPLEFGGVLTDNRQSGKITTFIEKPAWSQVFTDTVNTGIYIINNAVLELIPENKFFDFGKDLFPLMLRENYKLFGYIDDNYWCDVGDLDAYYKCNIDALEGKIEIVKQGLNYGRIKNNICIGENTKIGSNVKISPYSIISENCTIGDGSEIDKSIIHSGVEIGENAGIANSIICRDTKICDNAEIGGGCIIGEDCEIKASAKIAGNVKIWNNKIISEGAVIMSNVIFSGIKQDLFNDSGINGRFNENLSPEYCVKIGAAVGIAASGKNSVGRVGVMYSQNAAGKNNISRLIRDSLLCGIVSSGAKSYDFGEGFESLASFAAGHFRLDAMLFADRVEDFDEYGVKTGSHDEIKIFDKSTLNPPRPFERKLEAALSRDDYKYPIADELYDTEVFEGLKFLYFSEMIKSAKGSLAGFRVAIGAKNQEMNKSGTAAHILKKALTELSADVLDCDMDSAKYTDKWNEVSKEMVIEVSNNGLYLKAYDADAGEVDFWHIAGVLMKDAAKCGETELSVPYTAPHALQIIAENEGADVLRYLSCAFDEISSDLKAKSKIMTQLYLKDACFAAVRLCSVLHNSKKTLGQYMREIPQFASRVSDIAVEDAQKTRIMRELNRQIQQINNICSCSICKREQDSKNVDLRSIEGLRLNFLNGFVRVIPKRAGGFKLIAEAVNSEVAEEMLNAADDRIKAIIGKL